MQRLERRRGETWQGLWLAPLLTIVAQGFLLIVLADETIGWLARAGVLAAALASALAAAWSVLRAHAREVQYSEAIDAELAATAVGDYADVRAAALARPSRRPPAAAPARPGAEIAEVEIEVTEGEGAAVEAEEPQAAADSEDAGDSDGEGKTEVLDPTPTPPPPPIEEPKQKREDWVHRWDRHLVWWAAGESHAKSYMAWIATLGVFMLADVAVYLGS
ncbi:MAG: hypothetical protein JST31_16925, partial [Actinobacteria bacterium]|nr:hypothetical protein [Actinomycetota bacterium]